MHCQNSHFKSGERCIPSHPIIPGCHFALVQEGLETVGRAWLHGPARHNPHLQDQHPAMHGKNKFRTMDGLSQMN